MFSYIKDSNAFYVDSESEQEGSQSDMPLFVTHDTVEFEGLEIDEENYRLSEAELSKYAENATRIRADFERKAQEIDRLLE